MSPVSGRVGDRKYHGVHVTSGVFGGKQPTSNIARSSSVSDSTACAFATTSAAECLPHSIFDMVMQQGLHFGYAFADFPHRVCWLLPSRPVRQPLKFDDKQLLPQSRRQNNSLPGLVKVKIKARCPRSHFCPIRSVPESQVWRHLGGKSYEVCLFGCVCGSVISCCQHCECRNGERLRR